MVDARSNFRLRQQIPVNWSVAELNVKGQGHITNLSFTGLAFETDKLFSIDHGMVIELSSSEIQTLPSKGKVMWFKKAGEHKSHYHCGIKFIKTSATPAWKKWMDEATAKLGDADDSNVVKQYLGGEERQGS
jgi:hypothetical protein